ncbi:hypothetical protein ALP16_01551 [Pseudomonas savastanoi]|uniref:Response regulatory domain-containing protein n=1 Tax=Pseudomonas savastanoi TaxID=29438 RepID=A0A3M6AE42_PSESS|nr:hypothetical protein ALP16_01551 [Pseudomonas savastanoi]
MTMLRILLIDTARKVGRLKSALIEAGFEVIDESGLIIDLPARVEAVRPDVILIDTESPGRDVMEQVVLVSRDQPRPIVMFTDEHDPGVMRQAIKSGVSAYIVEGIQAQRLQPILDVAMARFESDQALRAQLHARDQQLAERPRLAEGLSVEAGWELAVETVLGADLQAVLVDDFDALDLANFQQGDLRLLRAGADTVRVPGSLLEKVDSTVDLSAWLGQVIPVEDLDEALARRAQLSAGQSLISRDGYWVGRHFLRVRRASEAQSGVLARGQELQMLGLERDEREATLATLEEQLLVLREQQSQQEEAREQLRRRVQDETRQQSELKAQLSAVRVKVEQLTLRRTRLDEELAELGEQRAVEHEHLGESRLQLQDALDSMAQDTEQREVLQAQRDALRERLDRIRQDARQHKDHSHQLAVRLGSLKAQYDSTRQALERLRMQSERLTEKREQLSLNLEEGEAPLEELRLKLEELLERRMVVDDEMRIAKNALEDADRELREAEKRRTQAEQQSQLLRGQLEQQRLEWQSLTVRRTALQDQLHEDGYDLHGVSPR